MKPTWIVRLAVASSVECILDAGKQNISVVFSSIDKEIIELTVSHNDGAYLRSYVESLYRVFPITGVYLYSQEDTRSLASSYSVIVGDNAPTFISNPYATVGV